MAAAAACAFLHLPTPKLHSPKLVNYQLTTCRSISSQPETPLLVPELDEQSPEAPVTLGGCPACGREEIENGCNGGGRIQGGIASVPGFGWWPIKAYRPCPAFVASGGRYRRTGQSMDEVVSGSGGKDLAKGTSGVSQHSSLLLSTWDQLLF